LILIQFLTNIPAYGINRDVVEKFLSSDTGSALSFFSMFSGNAFYQMSMFVLGVTPYISASIITQLLRVAIPSFDEMAKDGKVGEKRFKSITYILGAILAVVQTIPIVIGFGNYGLLIENNTFYRTIVSISIILGCIIVMILSHIIEKKGIGQGISLILLINILSRAPMDLKSIFDTFISGQKVSKIVLAIFIALAIFLITTIIVIYLQNGEERIKTQYASQLKGKSALNGTLVNNFIPLKVNISNVMPVIFTTSLFQTYILITTFVGVNKNSFWAKISDLFNTQNWFQTQRPLLNLGFLLYIVLIFLFGLFYAEITFDVEKISKNLRDTGGVIIGITPGKETEKYLTKKLRKASIIGSFGLIIVATIPIIVAKVFNIQSISLGGTSIIIIVGVIIDTYRAIKCEKLEQTNDSFLF
jgi:preprotein translocase subunit SecY